MYSSCRAKKNLLLWNFLYDVVEIPWNIPYIPKFQPNRSTYDKTDFSSRCARKFSECLYWILSSFTTFWNPCFFCVSETGGWKYLRRWGVNLHQMIFTYFLNHIIILETILRQFLYDVWVDIYFNGWSEPVFLGTVKHHNFGLQHNFEHFTKKCNK